MLFPRSILSHKAHKYVNRNRAEKGKKEKVVVDIPHRNMGNWCFLLPRCTFGFFHRLLAHKPLDPY